MHEQTLEQVQSIKYLGIPIRESQSKFNSSYHNWSIAEADLEGVQGVCSNPPLVLNHFIVMGNFKRFCMELGKRTPISCI